MLEKFSRKVLIKVSDYRHIKVLASTLVILFEKLKND